MNSRINLILKKFYNIYLKNNINNIFFIIIFFYAVVHLIYSFIFINYKLPILTVSNLVASAVFTVLLHLLNKRENKKIIYVFFYTVILNSAICTLFNGLQLGFDLQILSLIIICFFLPYKNKRSVYTHSIICIILFLFIRVHFYIVPGVITPIDNKPLFIISTLNYIVSIIPQTMIVIISLKNTENNNKFLIKQNSSLEILANTDSLTGLLNRRAIQSELDFAYKQYIEKNQIFSIILADIDNFKKVNDTYGHDYGDFVIKQISHIIVSSVKKTDFVARWGGEEFLVLLIDCTCITAGKRAEEIKQKIASSTFSFNNIPSKVTITLGVTDNCTSICDMIKRVDENLYEGKNSGKNRVIIK